MVNPFNVVFCEKGWYLIYSNSVYNIGSFLLSGGKTYFVMNPKKTPNYHVFIADWL